MSLKALPLLFISLICASSNGQGVACAGASCPVSFEGYNSAQHTVLCETYNETLFFPPITGQVRFSDEILIDSSKFTNCSSIPITKEWTYTYTLQETIEHSKSGDLSMQVAFKVGQKDVAEVGLAFAATDSTGWKWVDSFSQTKSDKTTVTVGPCKNVKLLLYGRKKIGDHLGSGRIDWTCDIERHIFGFPLEFFTASGECKLTTPRAHGEKWWFNLHTVAIDINPGCKPPSPCACSPL